MKKIIIKKVSQFLCFLVSSILIFAGSGASAQTDWKSQYVLPGSLLLDVAYGGGTYVAVGSESLIRTSSDGINWQTQETDLSKYASLTSVIYANGIFTAVGNAGIIITSSNGVSWQKQNSGTTWNFSGIAHGGNTYIAVGLLGSVALSKDGINWKLRQHATSKELFDIVYSGGLFVGVGTDGQIQTSADNGITWTLRSSGTTKELRAIAAGKNGDFVAAGDHGTILYSPNGQSWSVKPTADASIFFSGVACNLKTGKFIAVSSNSTKAVISDGLYWGDPAVQMGSSREFYAIRFLNHQFLAAGGGVLLRSSSTDGQSWNSATTDFWTMQMNGVAFGNDRYVAVGHAMIDNGLTAGGVTNLAITTTDGVHYSEGETIHLPGGANSFNDVTFGNGLFVAVGADAIIQTSATGLKWDYSQVTFGQTLKGVAFGNGRFVAVGNNGLVLWSTDAKSWTKANAAGTGSYNAVSFVNGQFVMVGQNGLLATSVTGVNWTFRQSGTRNHLHSVAYGSGKWMAVGFYNTVVTSSNAVSWTAQQLSPSNVHYTDVCYANGQFVMVAVDGKIYSSGTNNYWINPYSPAKKDLNSIAYGNGLFLAVGDGGTMVTSPDDNGQANAAPSDNGPGCTTCRSTFEQSAADEPSKSETEFLAAAYPNPVNDQFSIDVKGAAGGTVRLVLVDISGRTVLDKIVNAANGQYNETIRMDQKQRGLYVMKISSATKTQTLKILKY